MWHHLFSFSKCTTPRVRSTSYKHSLSSPATGWELHQFLIAPSIDSDYGGGAPHHVSSSQRRPRRCVSSLMETAWGCVKGGSGWVLGKGSSPEGGQATEQTAQGSGHSPKLLEFKELLDSALRHRAGLWVILCGAKCWTQIFLRVPSNLGYLIDSMIQCFYDSIILRERLCPAEH